MKSAKMMLLLPLCVVALAGCSPQGNDETLYLRNLYFSSWDGGDQYTDYIEEKFGVKISPSAYSWASWSEQVSGEVNSMSAGDVFHADVDCYNYANTYDFWAKGGVTKPLPTDMSKYPNLQKLINACSSIENFKIDGKLYGLPIVKDVEKSTSFSPFTYVYRRDWAKEYKVYQENDIYTWNQFKALLKAFKDNLPSNVYVLRDVEWGTPSVTNFYKQVPHCFAEDPEDGNKVVNNYMTDEYLEGLAESKNFYEAGYYSFDQGSRTQDGEANKDYVGNRAGVLYENLSYTNYANLRENLLKANPTTKDFNIDDASAIMKVIGPDGNYALEGTDNWFSMTFFNAKMSDAKMDKILSILDWLLTDEGKMLATYGFENEDYNIVDKQVVLTENGWPKDNKGKYVLKENGAQYLRYMCTLNYDIQEQNPLTDQDAFKILKDWEKEMDEALEGGILRVLKEPDEIRWLITDKKTEYSLILLDAANETVIKHVFSNLSLNDYKKKFNDDTRWSQTLESINLKLGR